MNKDTITSREMRALEQNAEYFGVSPLLLMENAGHCVACQIASRFKPEKSVAIFCGPGGNGGDGFVVARHLRSKGFKPQVFLAGKAGQITDGAAIENWKALEFVQDSIPRKEILDSSLLPEVEADIIVDALLGTGAKGNLRPPIMQLVKKINSVKAFRVAVDIPTGIDADTGQVMGEAVKADLTITFYRSKNGLNKAKRYVGELIVAGIGLPSDFESYVGPGDVLAIKESRLPDSHKGDFGRLLVIGGNETFSGAPTLVAMAALRTGVDLAYLAAPERTAYAISSLSPDFITIKLQGTHLNPENLPQLKEHVKNSNAVVIGPGLGLHEETSDALRKLISMIEQAGKPLLLDADGLKAFSDFKRKLKVPLVLTPHAEEFAILTGEKAGNTLSEKISAVKKAANDLKAVLLLKGHVDVISDGNSTKLNFAGNPGMTVGGTGDVLSGVVGAFMAQNKDPFEAAAAGAFVNGAAGDFVYKEKGAHMVASDLFKWIPHVLDDPMDHLQVRNSVGTKS